MNLLKHIISLSILGLIVAISPIFAHAAEFMDTSRSAKIIEGEVHAAIGASWVTQNYGDNIPQMQALNMTPGAMAGIGARVQLAIHDFFAIGTSATFNICNNSMTAIVTSREPDNTAGFTVDNHYYYLNIPVYASLRFNLADNVKWNVDGGFYYAYGIGGTSKSRIYITYQNDIGQFITEQFVDKDSYFSEDTPLLHDTHRSDYGLHIATGLKFYNHYCINFIAQYGLKNIAEKKNTTDMSVHNLNISVALGYEF